MAINVNQITAQLARMPDQSLRTLAQMHKSDPYIMALVAGESARRQEIRTASTAQAPGAMPPVNEQVIASLPEEQGIARIPMQTQFAAEGGIIGYDDGGVVRYNGADQSDVVYSDLGLPLYGGVPYVPTAPTKAKPEFIATTPSAAVIDPEQERRAAAEALRALNAGRGGGPALPSVPKLTSQYTPENVAAVMRAANVPSQEEATMSGLANLKSLQDTHMQEIAAARKRYEESVPQGELGAEAMERYKRQEAETPARRKEAMYMAMLEAGLGMMGTSSRYALQGIAEGAKQGVASYKNAMKDLDSLAETRSKAMDAINQARRAEKQGRADKALAFDNQHASLLAKYGMDTWQFLQQRADMNRSEAFMLATKYLDEMGADERAFAQMEHQLALKRFDVGRAEAKENQLIRTFLTLRAKGDNAAADKLMETLQEVHSMKQNPRRAAVAELKARASIDSRFAQSLSDPKVYEAELAKIMGGTAAPGMPSVPGVSVVSGRFQQ